MPLKSKTLDCVAGHFGASRDGSQAASHSAASLCTYPAQFLTMADAVRPEVATMLVVLAFGGGQ